jgi:hypothetical protein
MILQSLSSYLIVALGWRTTYRIYALPVFLLMPLAVSDGAKLSAGDQGFPCAPTISRLRCQGWRPARRSALDLCA